LGLKGKKKILLYQNQGLSDKGSGWIIIFDFQQLLLLEKIDPIAGYRDRKRWKS
jgi:hypothetical protein